MAFNATIGVLADILTYAAPSSQFIHSITEPYRGMPWMRYLGNLRSRPVYASWLGQPQQQDSPFFDVLPADIRLMIYELVLGGKTLHLITDHDVNGAKLRSAVCISPRQVHSQRKHQLCHFSNGGQSPRQDGLHLILACRSLYLEASSVLYSSNVFHATAMHTSFDFLGSAHAYGRLQTIRHLRFSIRMPRHPLHNDRTLRDWQELLDFFEHDMAGLLSLHLEIGCLSPVEHIIMNSTDEDGAQWTLHMAATASRLWEARKCSVVVLTNYPNCEQTQLHDQVRSGGDLHDIAVELHRRVRVSMVPIA